MKNSTIPWLRSHTSFYKPRLLSQSLFYNHIPLKSQSDRPEAWHHNTAWHPDRRFCMAKLMPLSILWRDDPCHMTTKHDLNMTLQKPYNHFVCDILQYVWIVVCKIFLRSVTVWDGHLKLLSSWHKGPPLPSGLTLLMEQVCPGWSLKETVHPIIYKNTNSACIHP